MKSTNLYFIIAVLLVSCNQKPKKEKFQYERVQENSSEVIQNNNIENTVILNSNDAMLFDKKVIKVNSGEKITLTLNHVGKIGKDFCYKARRGTIFTKDKSVSREYIKANETDLTFFNFYKIKINKMLKQNLISSSKPLR